MQLVSQLPGGGQLMWMTHVNPKPDDLYDHDQNHVLSFLSHNIMSGTGSGLKAPVDPSCRPT